jgi:hypothetical protein
MSSKLSTKMDVKKTSGQQHQQLPASYIAAAKRRQSQSLKDKKRERTFFTGDHNDMDNTDNKVSTHLSYL